MLIAAACDIVHRYWKGDIPCGLDLERVTEKQWYALGDDSTAPVTTAGGGTSCNTTPGPAVAVGGGRKRCREEEGEGVTGTGDGALDTMTMTCDAERARQEHMRQQALVSSLQLDASLTAALLATVDSHWLERGGGGTQMAMCGASPLEQTVTQGHLLVPRVGICDGSQGIINALAEWYPGLPRIGCYAHIVFNYGENKMLPTNHPMYTVIMKDVLQEMHTCHTEGMWKALKKRLRKTWKPDGALMKLYDKVFSGPNARWYLGSLVAGAIMPSQNTQEVCPHYSMHMEHTTTKSHTPRCGPGSLMLTDAHAATCRGVCRDGTIPLSWHGYHQC